MLVCGSVVVLVEAGLIPLEKEVLVELEGIGLGDTSMGRSVLDATCWVLTELAVMAVWFANSLLGAVVWICVSCSGLADCSCVVAFNDDFRCFSEWLGF